MAAYPTLPQAFDTIPEPLSGHQTDLAEDGTPRGRLFHAATTYRIRVHHPGLSATDKDSVQSFYDTNKALTFTFTWRGDTTVFDCVFESPPVVVKIPANPAVGSRFDVTVSMIGRRQ